MVPEHPYTEAQYTALVLEAATDAGRILLESGAEIFRVEETMRRIIGYFGVEHEDIYVLTNGIFISGNRKIDEAYARVLHVPAVGARLDRVIAVNQLSREIEQGRYTLDQVHERLVEIQKLPSPRLPLQVLACGLGCGCFSVMFGGSLWDGAAAVLSGALMQLFMALPGRHMSKLMGSMCCAALGAILCILCYTVGLGNRLSLMIIGSMMTLIPGVPFTNGVRDIADGDYLSGLVRMLDALLVFVGIAVGMAAVLLIYHRVFGGALL